MDLLKPLKKLRLESFNNLTKTLSFNIYDICYAQSEQAQKEYIAYIDEAYNAERLTAILTEVAQIIGASVLNIAHQDYDPQGASVTMLVSELPLQEEPLNPEAPGPLPDAAHNRQTRAAQAGLSLEKPYKESVVAHLDKSHITVHTYPESHPDSGTSTFRADIDVSTCGKISPLRALNYLIHSFDSDIVIIDYRVRGFTRDVKGTKHYIDHKINSIQNFVDKSTLARYQAIDVNVYQENIFHTKMLLKDFKLDNYLFGVRETDLNPPETKIVSQRLKHEMAEIFYGANMVRIT
ncbi:MAG: S-adenosylmethionine decarboxylase [Candidatus Muproteobacteria bacterium RIFCSPHIGHO2_01_FULL_65_16]|uniref:Adenosylmethionine decarboxylase n=2 Tax=Candidatus Muproteobacteria TaxID=1817795 RepID=A0A1F6TJQ7_9PROT|nr:MAG: S-adenosylmethionine decarboxylase [Candidatus Muproteobacteria bacterium RIFCSPHIGHO2_01_FULL_65_16]OGI45341.1 MAG: S-adenosylmethionine decarboxylase [Candidatus Muproteobacteria bacterium RBG_16_65_31]